MKKCPMLQSFKEQPVMLWPLRLCLQPPHAPKVDADHARSTSDQRWTVEDN